MLADFKLSASKFYPIALEAKVNTYL